MRLEGVCAQATRQISYRDTVNMMYCLVLASKCVPSFSSAD